jgi:hypothetical protein
MEEFRQRPDLQPQGSSPWNQQGQKGDCRGRLLTQKSSAKKPGAGVERIPSTTSAVGPEEADPLHPPVRAIHPLRTATAPPLPPARVAAAPQDRDAATRSIIAPDTVAGGPRTKARPELDTAPGATRNNAASEVPHTSASALKARTTEQIFEDLILQWATTSGSTGWQLQVETSTRPWDQPK